MARGGPSHEALARWEGGLRTTVSVGDFSFVVDEPVTAGGTGSGPMPTDYFLGSLASCYALAIVWEARKRDIEVPPDLEVTAQGVYDGPCFRELTVRVSTSLGDEVLGVGEGQGLGVEDPGAPEAAQRGAVTGRDPQQALGVRPEDPAVEGRIAEVARQIPAWVKGQGPGHGHGDHGKKERYGQRMEGSAPPARTPGERRAVTHATPLSDIPPSRRRSRGLDGRIRPDGVLAHRPGVEQQTA